MISLKNTAVIILTIGVWALLITVWIYPGDSKAHEGHRHMAYEIEGLADVTIFGVEGIVQKVISECTVKDDKINCNP